MLLEAAIIRWFIEAAIIRWFMLFQVQHPDDTHAYYWVMGPQF
jgi:hypothetical protein